MKKKLFNLSAIAVLTSLSLGVIACNKQSGGNKKKPEPVKATRLYVSNIACDLFVGLTYTINPVLYPYNATNNVKYEIGDPNVLYPMDNAILGIAEGTSLVYVYNDDNNDDVRNDDEAFTVMAFSVTTPASNIYFVMDNEVTITVDETIRLNYQVVGGTPSGLDYGYYSEDENICTFSGGNLKGHKPGTTRVSVSWQGYRGYCKVTVVDKEDEQGLRASEITAAESIVMKKGESKKIDYKILPKGTVDTLAEITVSDPSVLSVSNDNKVTALKGGSSIVTLTTTNDKFTRVLVTVKDDAQLEDSYCNNYYGDLTWENGEDLKAKLHNIISDGVTPLKYNSPNWETNQNADQYLYDFSYVKGVYNDDPILKTSTNTGWQREHAFAASLMTGFSTGDAVTSLGRATDFHNLFAASAGANGSRGNKNYGYVNPDSVELSSKENCYYTKKAWEPADDDKGRLARAIFYMDVMYNQTESVDITEKWTYRGTDIGTTNHTTASKTVHVNVDERPLSVVEGNVDYSRISINDFMYPQKTALSTIVEYYRSLIRAEQPNLETTDYDAFREQAYERYLNNSIPYAIGHYSDLLKWSSFPVDMYEMQHNNSVYSYNSAAGSGTQGNRNPFVDYPEFINYIYGELKDQPGSISMLTPSYLDLEMNQDEIHHYAVDSESLSAFESGTKPTAADFNIKAIKNDLTEGVLDLSKIQVEDYTFTDDDVETGKVITITTDKNTLYVPVKVTSDSVITFDNSTFSYKPSAGNKSDYTGSGTSWVANFDGTEFDVTFGAEVPSRNFTNDNTSGMSGVKIGSGTNKLISLTFVSKLSYTDVNAVFFYAAGSTNDSSVTYKVYVGDSLKFSGTISGSAVNVIGQTFAESTGKVKVEFSNVEGIKFCGLAFNY